MKKQALLACLSLLVCCSRAGENPLPIEPLVPRSDYDLQASDLKIQVREGGPHTLRMKVGADVWIWSSICNVGLQTIRGSDYTKSVEINGKIVRPPRFGEYSGLGPLVPGVCNRGSVSLPSQARYPGVWFFKPEEPGRYEFKYLVHLRPRLEEENIANNEIVVVVEVVQ